MELELLPSLFLPIMKVSRTKIVKQRQKFRSTVTVMAMRRALSERVSESSAAAWRAVPSRELRCRSRRTAQVAQARQAAMYFAHIVFAANLTRAGGIFGRDRTTARHACSRMEDWRDDGRIDRAFDALEPALRTWVEAFAARELSGDQP
jgi:chromosomal replication initiation ATPase DnaA